VGSAGGWENELEGKKDIHDCWRSMENLAMKSRPTGTQRGERIIRHKIGDSSQIKELKR